MMAIEWTIKPGKPCALKDLDSGHCEDLDKARAETRMTSAVLRMRQLQERLYAGKECALLIVLQGMDTAGKDGTVKKVFLGMNPQGVTITSFKAPTEVERSHDFLWRVHLAVPPRGMIGIFNRSHYEDVLVPRVRKWINPAECLRRFGHINAFERMLSENGVLILKFFLHVSKEEQKERLEKRLSDPEKHWKFDPADIEARKLWKNYRQAYEEALYACSTKWAPWTVVPADRKWYRNLFVAEAIVAALEKRNLRFPPPMEGIGKMKIV